MKTQEQTGSSTRSGEILVALRQVMRAVDLHSRQLARSHDLTGPQAIVLRELECADAALAPGELARRISLSAATVSDILKRLQGKELIRRMPDPDDHRRVRIALSAAGRRRLAESPPLLQETFVSRFEALADWEQNLLLASVQRVARLMDAERIDAAPVLTDGPGLDGRG